MAKSDIAYCMSSYILVKPKLYEINPQLDVGEYHCVSNITRRKTNITNPQGFIELSLFPKGRAVTASFSSSLSD